MLFNLSFLLLCLAVGTLGFTVQDGNATRWYSTGQPPSCNPGNTDPALTVAISPSFNLASYCATWLQITNTGGGRNGDNAGNNSVRATVTGTCSTCSESDLSLGSAWFNALLVNGSSVYTTSKPSSFGIEWHFCDAAGKC